MQGAGQLGEQGFAGFDASMLQNLLQGSSATAGAALPSQAHQWVLPAASQQAAWPGQDAMQQQAQLFQQPAAHWAQATFSGGSGANSAGLASGSRLDAATMASKLAVAREKNRLAQQRFRERQREKQKQAGQQCKLLQDQIDEIEEENERLQRQNRIYEKVLAVRDAMLSTFTSLHPPSHQQPLQPQQAMPPMAAAAQGLARAINELPSAGELEEASPPQQSPSQQSSPQSQQQPPATQQEQEQGGLSNSSSACPDPPRPPSSVLSGQHRSAVAYQLDGSALRHVEIIPNIQDESVRSMVLAMTEPEHLLDYYRQWQAELSVSYLAAESAGFDDVSVADVEAIQERMTQVWWHVGEMKPSYLCYLANAALPEDSGQLSLWRDIAAEVFPQMDETQRALLRRAWHKYSKRLTKLAVGVSRWAKKLQEYAVQPIDSMVSNANRSLELLEITNHIAAAVQEEYIANMEFVAEQAHTTTAVQKAYINHASAPFLPDVVAIDYHILLMDAEERRARARGQPNMLPAAVASSPAPPATNVAPGT